MTEQNLIINGVDHAKFDLEWAKRGGVVMLKKHLSKVTYVCNISGTLHVAQTLGRKVFNGESFANVIPRLLRMATPQECAEGGVEYIEPPMVWRSIETAPKDGTEFLGFNSKTKGIKIFKYDNDIYARKPKPFFSSGNPRVTDDRENQPTHWMPLPPDPKDE